MNFNEVKWAKLPSEVQSAYIVKDFFFDGNSKNTTIYVCGLGYFYLYINEKIVSNEKLNPVWSNYSKRDGKKFVYETDDEMTDRFYYRKYDISKFLHKGRNRIGLILGNGWYRQTERTAEGEIQYGNELKCAFLVLQDEKTLATSESEVYWKKNEIVFNNVYYGEKHDLRLLDEKWNTPDYYSGFSLALPTTAPSENSEEQTCPSDIECEKILPKLISDKNGIKTYDVGFNTTGYAEIFATKEKATVKYSERVNEDFSLDFRSAGNYSSNPDLEQVQTNEYLFADEKSLLKPYFTIHGFRYFTVEGGVAEYVVRVNADLKQTAKFSCGNANIQWLYEAYIRTQLNNMHSGVPSDCPHRERLGYTGDGQLTAEVAMLSFGARTFYEKWIRDIFDGQDKATGHIQHTAPFYGGGGGPGGWGSAAVIVPYMHYKTYCDIKVLEDSFPKMLKWVDSMEGFSVDGLVVKEIEKGWCLGDWCTPTKVEIPEEIVNTYYYAISLQMINEIASVLKIMKTIDRINAILQKCLNALKEKYVIEGKPVITVQGADAFLIDLGLCDEKAVRFLAERYENSGSFDTGIFGTDVLIKVLLEKGFYSVAYKLLTATEYPSFGYMKEQGATTLWERWGGFGSRNHPMFGAVVKNFYSCFAGITPNEKYGYDEIKVEPKLCKDLMPLSFSYETENGKIEINYCDGGEKVVANIRCEGIKAHVKGETFENTVKTVEFSYAF